MLLVSQRSRLVLLVALENAYYPISEITADPPDPEDDDAENVVAPDDDDDGPTVAPDGTPLMP